MVNTNTKHFLQLLCGVKLNTMIFAKQKKKLSERKKHINAQLILRSNTLKPSLRKMFVCFIPNDWRKKTPEEFHINALCNSTPNPVRKNPVVSKSAFQCIKMDVWYLRDFESKKMPNPRTKTITLI